MAPTRITQKQKLVTKAIDLLKAEPDGLRYSELVRRLARDPDFSTVPHGTITGSVYKLDRDKPNDIFRPSHGLFQHAIYRSPPDPVVSIQPAVQQVAPQRATEADFYLPFADWLTSEAEVCTKAVVVGGKAFADRWGTPDVMGIKKSRPGDFVTFPTEIVAAEIKLDKSELITAFGQACSYILFSHKSYVVVPATSAEADVDRLDALCSIFGIGLVRFDNTAPNDPRFAEKVRPTRHDPDMFHVNKRAKEKAVEKLFS